MCDMELDFRALKHRGRVCWFSKLCEFILTLCEKLWIDNIDGDPILRSEFEKASKDLNPQKSVGVISAELLSSLGQEKNNWLFQFISKICETVIITWNT